MHLARLAESFFGAWLVGPPVDSYLNENGVPEYGYKYSLTDPKGTSMDFGVYSIYMPGFATTISTPGLLENGKSNLCSGTEALNQSRRSFQSSSPLQTRRFVKFGKNGKDKVYAIVKKHETRPIRIQRSPRGYSMISVKQE